MINITYIDRQAANDMSATLGKDSYKILIDDKDLDLLQIQLHPDIALVASSTESDIMFLREGKAYILPRKQFNKIEVI